MKIIITENQLNDNIIKFLDDYFDVTQIHYTPIEDKWGNETDNWHFYFGDYDDEDGFAFYFTEYNDYLMGSSGEKDESKYPILSFEEYIIEKLDNLFGELWINPFKSWFEKNFDFYIKTII
jgi:hypothetical protein